MKLVLLYSFLIGGLHAEVLVSSDRFLLKIIDRTVSQQDIAFQLRNLKAVNCIYPDAYVVQFFENTFIRELDKFMSKFPSGDDEVRRYMHENGPILKKVRQFFKMLRYSEDQKSEISPQISKIVRELAIQNKCNSEVLYKDTLKTNFISLLEMELYLRSRYGGQIKQQQKFDVIKPSIELFVESLDKQFAHEYYW